MMARYLALPAADDGPTYFAPLRVIAHAARRLFAADRFSRPVGSIEGRRAARFIRRRAR